MANEKRLIDANELVPYLWALFKFFGSIPCTEADKATQRGIKRCIGEIKKMPTVDAVEVVHGEWNTIEDDYVGLVALQCSKCNEEYWFEEELPTKGYNYCPNCGAKMDGDGNG